MAVTFPSWITQAASWNEDVIFLLDRELRFVDCNPEWDRFAERNGGRDLARDQMRGRPVLDYVPDSLRTYYVQKYWFAQRSAEWIPLDYDCSSPDKIRLYRMTMRSAGEGVLVVNHLRLEEACEPRAPLTAAERMLYISHQGIASMCANCRKTRRRDDSGTWDWIAEFLQERELKVSHGLCPRCAQLYY
jgi:hypothetical protein